MYTRISKSRKNAFVILSSAGIATALVSGWGLSNAFAGSGSYNWNPVGGSTFTPIVPSSLPSGEIAGVGNGIWTSSGTYAAGTGPNWVDTYNTIWGNGSESWVNGDSAYFYSLSTTDQETVSLGSDISAVNIGGAFGKQANNFQGTLTLDGAGNTISVSGQVHLGGANSGNISLYPSTYNLQNITLDSTFNHTSNGAGGGDEVWGATLNIGTASGGATFNASGYLAIGGNLVAAVNVNNGGTLVVNNLGAINPSTGLPYIGNIRIGGDNGAGNTHGSTLNVYAGGSVTVTGSAGYIDLSNGHTTNGATGYLNMYGGTLSAGLITTPADTAASPSNQTGTLNLNGGTVTTGMVAVAPTITAGKTGTTVVNFNGGTLQVQAATLNATSWIQQAVTANVNNGGAILDVNGTNPTVDAALSGVNANGSASTGGLTVTNSSATAGTLTLAGSATFNGPTDVQTGATLALAAGGTINGTSALTIASGATLSLGNTNAGNEVIIDYGSNPSPNSAIQGYITSGAITAPIGYAVGYADGADGVVSGLSAGQEKIMATIPGDTNLKGSVNLGDYSTVYNNVGITSGATWDQGDFTNSRSVTLGDLSTVYNNVGLSLTAGPMISAGTSQGAGTKASASVMASSSTPVATDISLTVNTTTGDAILVFNNPSAQFYAWEITSSTGGLSYANLTDITNYSSGPHARGPTSLDGVYSGASSGGYYNPGGTWNLGDIITPADITSGALDFSFNEFNPSSGFSVTFDPATINYAVPVPGSLAMFALGGVGLLLLGRKRWKV